MSHHVHLDLLRLIPPDARVLREVGCGAGALAEAYRWINPDGSYLGIEKVAEAALAAEASGRLDRVVIGDAEAAEPGAPGLPDYICNIRARSSVGAIPTRQLDRSSR